MIFQGLHPYMLFDFYIFTPVYPLYLRRFALSQPLTIFGNLQIYNIAMFIDFPPDTHLCLGRFIYLHPYLFWRM